MLPADAADPQAGDLIAAQPAGPALPPGTGRPPGQVRPGVQLLLDNLTDCPALVFGCRIDVLAWNDLGGALHDVTDEARSRDMPRRVFLDPQHGPVRYPN